MHSGVHSNYYNEDIPQGIVQAYHTLEVFYVLPIDCILGNLLVVPIGASGFFPFSMQLSAVDFVDTTFDRAEGAGDGSRWWYANTWALGWYSKA